MNKNIFFSQQLALNHISFGVKGSISNHDNKRKLPEVSSSKVFLYLSLNLCFVLSPIFFVSSILQMVNFLW